MDKICVLMSTYNGDKYIEEQLNSILAQSGDYELRIIVRDDGSKDKTLDILETYQQKYDNISVIKGENIGWRKSFNKLIFEAENADYYAFSDQDDYWLPDKLSTAITKIKKFDEDLPILYCSVVTEATEDLKPISQQPVHSKKDMTGLEIMFCNLGFGCTMVFNYAAKKLYTKSPKSMDMAGHDWLLATLCGYFGKIIFDRKSRILHRRHGGNATGKLTFLDIAKTKIRQFKQGRIGNSVYQELYNGYRNELPLEDKKIIEDLMHYKKSVKAKIRLFVNPKIKKYTLKGTLILKLAILCNRYV